MSKHNTTEAGPSAGHRAGRLLGAPWIERARPALGTLVRVGVQSAHAEAANVLIDRAFGEVARIHALMSFHEPTSDVSRLNREASAGDPVRVHTDTLAVLRVALSVAAASDGAFDPTIAPTAVAAGYLPAPQAAPFPDAIACWRDIDLTSPDRVAFRRPLWIDLGGIAKGYAVDRAFAILAHGCEPDSSRRVDAGGDLRVGGAASQRIRLDVPDHAAGLLPEIEIEEGSLASSATSRSNPVAATHWHGRHRQPLPPGRFAAVLAPHCVIADALTKVVLVQGAKAQSVLEQFSATAWVHEPGSAWQALGALP